MKLNPLLVRVAITLCASFSASVALAQVVIDFSSGTNLSTSATSIYKQDGFTLTSSDHLPPDDLPFATKWTFSGVANHDGVGASFAFPGSFSLSADDGRLFRLQGFAVANTTFDWTNFCHLPGGPSTTPSVQVTGRLSGAFVFGYTGQGPCPPPSFGDAPNPFASALVDQLVFSAIALDLVSADNIVLAPVSEPTDFALMVMGLGALSFRARSTRRRASHQRQIKPR